MITDAAVDAASASDQQDVVAVLDRLDETGHKPTELFARFRYRGHHLRSESPDRVKALLEARENPRHREAFYHWLNRWHLEDD